MAVQPKASLSFIYHIGKLNKVSVLFVFGLVPCLNLGCASQPQAPATKDYILAARYDLGRQNAGAASGSPTRLVDNLRKFKALGFDAVVFDYAADADRARFIDAAASAGLRAYVTD